MLMFVNARLKLTLWYFLVISLLTTSITSLFYIQTGVVLEREYDRIEHRLQREALGMQMMPGFELQSQPLIPGMRRLLPEDLVEARQKILLQLMTINIGIIGIFTGLGYLWSGRALAPIQAAHESQQRFIADAAHELKTPITAMRTSLEVNLMDRGLTQATQKVLTENLTDVKALEQLVKNLLNFSMMEERPRLLEAVNLTDVSQRVLKLVEILAKAKKIDLKFDLPKTQVKVWAEPQALTEVLVILVDNAIKYSRAKAPIELKIGQFGRVGWVSVTDHGPGMSVDQTQHIFERFYRADSARNKQTSPGFGLGLAIAKDLMSLQKGQIQVTSILHQGSVFTVKLPLA